MERLLHYVWKYRLYEPVPLITTEGQTVEVIDPGIPNGDAGPDFFNAKIRLAGAVWAGNVEIHEKASDWLAHHHGEDKAYDTVILHVVGEADFQPVRSNGRPIPQAVLHIPGQVSRNIDWLLYRETAFPCFGAIRQIDPLHLTGWLASLLSERLERKTQDIHALLDAYRNDWNEVFYITLSRNFGFGLNSDAFERLARSLPLRCIRKQRSSHTQVEAMFFGQAGILDEENDDRYYRLLQQEYAFLRRKFGLRPTDRFLFRNLRTRPDNFPYLRVAQLAAIWVRHDTLFSSVLEAGNMREIKELLRVPPFDYWKNHYHFRCASPPKDKTIGGKALDILLVNTVVPLFFAYGLHKKRPEYNERALWILEHIRPEQNSVVSHFCKAGIAVRHAGDTQALIQLKREYCEKKKCLFCRIGFRIVKSRQA